MIQQLQIFCSSLDLQQNIYRLSYGQLPDKIDNNYLGDKYVNSIFKDATVNHLGTITVGDNIVELVVKQLIIQKLEKLAFHLTMILILMLNK
ncbi:MAG: hypothetical protein CM15mV24_0740 [Bellamyvirus sp.]|nr:MAG: hypothetical protein CM15mV24_0740 [Bellamyvirus sp.]